jgi:hypothetical protein
MKLLFTALLIYAFFDAGQAYGCTTYCVTPTPQEIYDFSQAYEYTPCPPDHFKKFPIVWEGVCTKHDEAYVKLVYQQIDVCVDLPKFKSVGDHYVALDQDPQTCGPCIPTKAMWSSWKNKNGRYGYEVDWGWAGSGRFCAWHRLVGIPPIEVEPFYPPTKLLPQRPVLLP